MPRNHRTISSRNGAKSTNGRTSYGSIGNPMIYKRLRGKPVGPMLPKAVRVEDAFVSGGSMKVIDVETGKVVKRGTSWQVGNYLKQNYDFPEQNSARKNSGDPVFLRKTLAGIRRKGVWFGFGGLHAVQKISKDRYLVKQSKGRTSLAEGYKEIMGEPLEVSLDEVVDIIINEKNVNPNMSNPFTSNSVSSSNIRGPRRERNFNLADSIAVGLGSAIGGALGTSVAEPLIDRAKKWLNGRRRNGTFAEAQALSEAFHGREANEVIDVFNDYYNGNAAGLGKLVELHLMCDSGKHELPITFDDSGDRTVYVAAPHKRQIIFAGGDQQLDYELIARECGMSPRPNAEALVDLGPVYQIVYFADKHHLEGPKQQKKGMQYFHNFGEESGILPSLFYDVEAEQMLLVGGNYHIEDVGIVD